MSLSIPPPWLLTLDTYRARLEHALQLDLGIPVTIAGDPDRAVIVATTGQELAAPQLELLLDGLAPMWPDALAPWRIGLEVDAGGELWTFDAGQMAVRAAGVG